VSEYQCYEFVAIDRPLTAKQVAELRAISSRAEIADALLERVQLGQSQGGPRKARRALLRRTPLLRPGKRRTVAELQAVADALAAEREKAEAAREKKAREAAARTRERHLDELGRNVDAAWARLETLIEARSYDDATKLAADLRDVAARDGDAPAFATRFKDMRKRQSRRRGFFERWNRVNAPGKGSW
jgi:hypothetical protein